MANEFPGDYSLLEVSLFSLNESQKLDIKPLVVEINIYESIIASALQSEILIQDIGQNLISSLPIVGQERVEILLATDRKQYRLNFSIYKIDSRSMEEKNQVYLMSCISIEALRNENFRICERVDGKKTEEIISDVLGRNSFSTKGFDGDSTVFPFNMYIPNWRPFDLFNWLSTRSVPEYKKDSIGFLFYETLDGYKFKSIDWLIDQDEYPRKGVKYTFFQGNTSGSGVDEKDKYRISGYSTPKAFNIYDDLRRGAFAHNCIYLDVNRATYKVFKTTADDFWEDSSHLEKTKPYVTDGSAQLLERGSRFIYRPSTISTWGNWEENQSTEGTENIDEVNKNFEKAFYRYYFLEYSQLDISVPGDMRVRAGNIINVSIPSPKKAEGNRVPEDKRLSGKYMVSAVKHTLNRNELRTYITLSRDSYGGKSMPDRETSGNQVNLDGIN
tara:strand:+ start:4096 stop:5424 length:1329 start_codon:yes stop_codon:yes gene_type:complete